MKNQSVTKAIYTKPALIEYGSLTQRTKILQNRDPNDPQPDALVSAIQTLLSIFPGQ